MFKITPIQEKTRQNEICGICGAIFRPEAFAYQMFDIGDSGYIYDIKEVPGKDDFEAMFILARQTMNFIDLCGAHTCMADKNSATERLLIAAGFKIIDGEYFCNMTGMFDGHCDGHKVEL